MYYGLLGVDETTSLEDLKTAFRVNTLNNNDDFDTLENAYMQILNQKELNKHSEKTDMNISTQPVNIVENILKNFTNNESTPPIKVDLNNIVENLFGVPKERDETVVIEKEITIKQLYDNKYIGNILNVDDLKHISVIDFKYNIENEIKIDYGNSSKIYKITLLIREDNNFKIINKKLHYVINLSLKEALLGFTYTLNHLNGKEYTLKNKNKIVNNYSNIVLNKLGFINDDNVDELIINFNIIFPEKLTEEQKESLENLL